MKKFNFILIIIVFISFSLYPLSFIKELSKKEIEILINNSMDELKNGIEKENYFFTASKFLDLAVLFIRIDISEKKNVSEKKLIEDAISLSFKGISFSVFENKNELSNLYENLLKIKKEIIKIEPENKEWI